MVYNSTAAANDVAEKIELILRKNKLPEDIHWRAKQKLILIFSARNYNDLCQINGNHCKKLNGKLKTANSIRINGQWRIEFRWNTKENTVDENSIKFTNDH